MCQLSANHYAVQNIYSVRKTDPTSSLNFATTGSPFDRILQTWRSHHCRRQVGRWGLRPVLFLCVRLDLPMSPRWQTC